MSFRAQLLEKDSQSGDGNTKKREIFRVNLL